MNEEEIFRHAATLSSHQRAAYLQSVCEDDAGLRGQVEQLLAFHDDSSFMQRAADCPAFAERAEFTRASPEAEGERIGNYKLLRQIGQGGFGVVWLADQLEPVRRRVALKIIKLGMDTRSVIARFQQEQQALALMEHPNVAKVLDAGATPHGRPYFVMELAEGIHITQFCAENALSIAARLQLFIVVCQAVQHAHQKGIIHRDLKPSNILVTLRDGTPVPKIIDFGIAKATAGQRLSDETVFTSFEQFIGTPAYMSPEQAERSGTDVDTRSDIYSLGVLLYELLTGQTPFDPEKLLAGGIDEMRKTIREKEPVRPSANCVHQCAKRAGGKGGQTVSARPKIPDDLDWIVMKCLEKDRTRRYETANGLAADLKRHLDNEPVTARSPSTGYRFHKAWRRNKLVFSASAAVMAALLVGMAAAMWQAGVAQNAVKELESSLYVTRLTAAHYELTTEPSHIRQAELLLEACRPVMRDWEWRYLSRLRLAEPFLLRAPDGEGVNSLSFSGDGRFMAAAGGDGNVRIWDITAAETPRAPVQTLPAHTNFVFCVAFDPVDSTRIISAGADKRVKLWNWKTGRVVKSWPCAFSFEWGLAYAVAFSRDGRRVAFYSEVGCVRIFSTTTFEELEALRFESSRPVFSLSFSPDGRRLAVGQGDGFVRIWELPTRACSGPFGELGTPIGCVAFSRDGQRLAAASFDGSVQIWTVEELKSRPLRFQAHTDLAVGLAFSADGKRLATASHDRTVKLWDPRTGRSMLILAGFAKETCLAFSADGNRLAASAMDGTIRLWDAKPVATAEGKGDLTIEHLSEVQAMAVSSDGSLLATGLGFPEKRGTASISVWETATGRRIRKLRGYAVFVFSLAFSPDGRFLASVGDDQGPSTVTIWDLKTGLPAFTTEPYPDFGTVLFCVAYSPGGRRIVAAGQDNELKVWDAATGFRRGVLGEHDRNVFNLAFSPDGRFLVSAGKDGKLRIWDGTRLDEHQISPREMALAGGEIADTLAFNAQGTRLAVRSRDLRASIWDVATGTNVLTLRDSEHGFNALAFSPDPDGRWLASGGLDSTVKVWDTQTGVCLHTFRGHQDKVRRLQFVRLSEGLHLVSGSSDQTVKFLASGLTGSRCGHSEPVDWTSDKASAAALQFWFTPVFR